MTFYKSQKKSNLMNNMQLKQFVTMQECLYFLLFLWSLIVTVVSYFSWIGEQMTKIPLRQFILSVIFIVAAKLTGP